MARTVVGLEVASTAVRAVEVRHGRGGPVVRRQGRVALPPGAVEAGLVHDEAAVAAALRQLWADQRFSTRAVHLGIGTASVLVRQLELDWMPDADLRRSLRYQVADLLPVPVDDANLDHVVLGEREATDERGLPRRLVRILLVAAAREAVDGLLRSAHRAGLQPVSADLAAFGALRASRTADDDAVEALVDVGADKVSVVVHRGGLPLFVRITSGTAGAMLTRVLVEQTGRTWEEAERLKATAGTLPTVGAPAHTQEEAVLLEAVTRLVGDLRATLEFHAGSDPSSTPDRVLLTGRGARLAGLREHAEAAIGLPVRVLTDPTAPEADLGDLLVPFGLCLGRAA